MDDRCIMENMLLTTKGVCDLYLHGTIESSTSNVRDAFDQALNSSLEMQDELYKKMSSKGWYNMEQADSMQIQKVKNQYSGMAQARIKEKRPLPDTAAGERAFSVIFKHAPA